MKRLAVALGAIGIVGALALSGALAARPAKAPRPNKPAPRGKGPVKIPWPTDSAGVPRGTPPAATGTSSAPTRVRSEAVPLAIPVPEPTTRHTRVSASAVVDKLRAARGGVLVYATWATWCPSGEQELAVLDEIARRYVPRGARVVVLSVDDDQDGLAKFLGGHPTRTELVWCGAGPECDVTRGLEALGVKATRSVPVTRVFRKGGELQGEWNGALALESLAQTIEPLLTE